VYVRTRKEIKQHGKKTFDKKEETENHDVKLMIPQLTAIVFHWRRSEDG
jgi:hypothetical protein